MMHYRITLEGEAFDVRILDDPLGERVRVRVDDEVYTVDVTRMVTAAPGGSTAAPDRATSAAPRTEGHSVLAPLPGVVKSIAVEPGQGVAPNQELLVIEAMKMDNLIRATRAGTVDAIHVAVGQRVAHGDPLLDFAD
ncbi:MAG: acetyl-CoA carboxylase biotin carboxyl carrier protein subunit [Anaerolineae bacterium]|jgi:biotin carboxyl carrier protein